MCHAQALGYTVVPSFTITKLLWLKRHEPEVWRRVAHVLLPGSYVNWWLCGVHAMEVRGGEAGHGGGACSCHVASCLYGLHHVCTA